MTSGQHICNLQMEMQVVCSLYATVQSRERTIFTKTLKTSYIHKKKFILIIDLQKIVISREDDTQKKLLLYLASRAKKGIDYLSISMLPARPARTAKRL